MEQDQNLEKMYLDYIGQYQTMALATIGIDGDIDCSSVYYAFDKHGVIFFGTNGDSRKARHLEQTKRFSGVMDDGGVSTRGVKLSGSVEKVTRPEDVEQIKAALIKRIPNVKAFIERPDISFYSLRPTRRVLINFAWGVNWKLEIQ